MAVPPITNPIDTSLIPRVLNTSKGISTPRLTPAMRSRTRANVSPMLSLSNSTTPK